VAAIYNSGIFTTANANCVLYINGTITSVLPNVVSVLGSVKSDGTVTVRASVDSNVSIRQDSLAWLDSSLFIQGMQFQDAISLPARAFLGEGSAPVILTFDQYYSIGEGDDTVNTVLASENNQMIISEED
jgi:hypothetical protein